MQKNVLTCADIQERLHCSKGHVSKLINGKLKGTPRLRSFSIGRSKRVREEEFDRWLEEAERCSVDH